MSAHREKWFEQLQILWVITIATGTYQPCEKLARAALEMLAAREGIDLANADEKSRHKSTDELPAFAEVPGVSGQLRVAKFRLVALTTEHASPPGPSSNTPGVWTGSRPSFPRRSSSASSPRRSRTCTRPSHWTPSRENYLWPRRPRLECRRGVPGGTFHSVHGPSAAGAQPAGDQTGPRRQGFSRTGCQALLGKHLDSSQRVCSPAA